MLSKKSFRRSVIAIDKENGKSGPLVLLQKHCWQKIFLLSQNINSTSRAIAAGFHLSGRPPVHAEGSNFASKLSVHGHGGPSGTHFGCSKCGIGSIFCSPSRRRKGLRCCIITIYRRNSRFELKVILGWCCESDYGLRLKEPEPKVRQCTSNWITA